MINQHSSLLSSSGCLRQQVENAEERGSRVSLEVRQRLRELEAELQAVLSDYEAQGCLFDPRGGWLAGCQQAGTPNFGGLVLGCMDSYDSETRIFCF